MRLNPKKAAIFMILTILAVCLLQVAVLAEDQEYSISDYDVTINVNKDGSCDITDRIGFTFYGGFNNIMIPISKNEGETIEINHVYIARKNGFIDCKKLLAGQWDAEVFTGTYSVIDENDIVKLKLYGTFGNSFGSVIVQYRVTNAVRRYRDVAEYRRMHILKSWETRISNIHVFFYLPVSVNKQDITPYLHGVFVGSKMVRDQRSVDFNVPDTVPGEYVETRILFPESILSEDYPYLSEEPVLETVLAEELEYQKSDKLDLLEARENAARKAGQEAFNDRLAKRAKTISTVLSLFLSVLGLYVLLLLKRKIRLHKVKPLPDTFRSIEKLDPAEVRMLLANGQTGARAMLGNLLTLASRDVIKLSETADKNKPYFSFRISGPGDMEALAESDRYLMGWIAGLSADTGVFDPKCLMEYTKSAEKARGLKEIHDQWEDRVRDGYNEKYLLDEGIVRYRNLGMIFGSFLVAAGLVVPVILSIAAGYLMLPVGMILLLYSLRIRKHTDYGTWQHRIWKTLLRRIKQNSLALDQLPEWMKSFEALMGYGVALGCEKEIVQLDISLTEHHPEGCQCALCTMSSAVARLSPDATLLRVLKNTLALFDEVLSSVQDAD